MTPEPTHTILIVDNSSENRANYRQYITQELQKSYTILEEECGRDGLALCQSNLPDVILLNFLLPDFNGLEFLSVLKTQFGNACPPTIILSAQADETLVVNAIKGGAENFLVEERTTPEKLQLALRNAIANAELRKELQRSEERFRASVENMLDCLGIFSAIRDETGQIIDFSIDYLNAAACQCNRMTKEEQIGKRLCELLPAHRETGLFEEYCQVVEAGQPLIKESLIYCDTFGSGRELTRAFDIRASKFHDGFVASWRDVTARKQAEIERELLLEQEQQAVRAAARDRKQFRLLLEQLHQSEAKFRRIFDSNMLGIFFADFSGQIYDSNDAFLAMVGYTRQDLKAGRLNWHNLTPPEYQRQSELGNEQLQQDRIVSSFEKEYIRKDGSRVPVLINIALFDSEEREGDGVCIVQDLSARKQAQAELTAQEKRYRYIFDAVGVSIWEEDFTEVKAAIAQLKIQEISDFQQYFRENPEFVQQAMSMVRIRNVNQATVRMFGAQDKSELLVSLQRVFMPDNMEGFIKELLTIAAGETFLETEMVLQTLAGEPINVLLTMTFPPEEEPFDCVLVTLVDISERKRAESEIHQLNQSLERRVSELQALFDLLPIGVAIAQDPDCRDIRINSYLAPLLRLPVDANASHSLPESERPTYKVFQNGREMTEQELPMQYVARENTEMRDFILDVVHPDGTTIKLLSSALPLLDEEGRVRGAIGAFVDITERVRVEEELKEKETRLSLAMNAAHLGFWELDWVSRKSIWSDKSLELLGLPPNYSDRNYETFLARVHPDDRSWVNQTVLETVETKGSYQIEFRVVWLDGSLHWLSDRGQVLLDEAGGVIRLVGVAWDISDRKQAEAERAELLAKAEAANRSKDEFLAMVSHELRSPLNAILGWVSLLRTANLDLANSERALEIVERNVKLQDRLIEDLLDISRMIQGRLRLDVAPISLVSVIYAAIDVVRPLAQARQIQLGYQLDNSVGQVLGDFNRLQQVIWNLLTNAIKFTPEGGRVEVRLEKAEGRGQRAEGDAKTRGHGDTGNDVDVGIFEDNLTHRQKKAGKENLSASPRLPISTSSLPTSYAQITVTDTGKGISPEFLPFVFERYQQEARNNARQGLGLGLAIVRHLVELHNGTVSAFSAGEGQGATFTVIIPLIEQIKAAPATTTPARSSLNGLRILLVDDELDNREFLRLFLEQQGAVAIAVASAPEALAAIEQHKPDLLISDISMPEVNGYTLIERVRALTVEQGGQIPAIALTAYASLEDRQKILAAGFQLQIVKPFDLTSLINAIADLIQK